MVQIKFKGTLDVQNLRKLMLLSLNSTENIKITMQQHHLEERPTACNLVYLLPEYIF